MFGQHGNCLALHILLCHEGDMRCAQTLQYSWSRGKVEGGRGRKSVSHNKKSHKPFPTPPVPRTKYSFPTVPNKLNYWHKSGKTRNYEIVSVLGNVWLCEVEMVRAPSFWWVGQYFVAVCTHPSNATATQTNNEKNETLLLFSPFLLLLEAFLLLAIWYPGKKAI